MEIANLPDVSGRCSALKSYTYEDGEVTAAMPGEKLLRWIAVSFCVLCVLQAALNISLRHALCIDSNCKNWSEEGEELKRINYGNLTEEWNKLKRNLTLQLTTNNEERGELKKQLNYYAIQERTLTEEINELKKKLDDFIHYSQQGWVFFSGSFYFISSDKKNWQQSRDECLQNKADLMIINRKEEQDFLRRFPKVMWIGLTDIETEGVWKWVDGTLLSTSFWHYGEPNNYNGRNEDCGEIWHYDREDSWNDGVCENLNFWICEKKMAL